ncbi:MAG: hypothetical protein PVJ39_11345 [Gammaproteobacteria bacterium]|jgi:hypothetical protein
MVKYELYICDVTGEHKPIAKFESGTPFMPVTVNERFDDHGWDRLEGVGKIASEEDPIKYIVHSIKNTVIEKNGVLFIQYWLNLLPYEGPRSPAWGGGE